MNVSSINQQALLKSAGIGAAVLLLVTLVNTGLQFAATQMGGDAGAALASAVGFLGICTCCLSVLAYMGVGALYGYFAGQTGTPVETGPMALGGAASSVAVGVVIGLCGGVLGLITGVSQMSALQGLSGSDAAVVGAAGIVGGVIGLAVGLCVAIVISAVLGAAGGAIYAAVQGNKTTPAAPPPAM